MKQTSPDELIAFLPVEKILCPWRIEARTKKPQLSNTRGSDPPPQLQLSTTSFSVRRIPFLTPFTHRLLPRIIIIRRTRVVRIFKTPSACPFLCAGPRGNRARAPIATVWAVCWIMRPSLRPLVALVCLQAVTKPLPLDKVTEKHRL